MVWGVGLCYLLCCLSLLDRILCAVVKLTIRGNITFKFTLYLRCQIVNAVTH